MNIKTIVAAATLLLTAGATFADTLDSTLQGPVFKSSLTRADVQNELRDAMAKGSFTEAGYVLRMPEATASRSREVVRAEAIASLKMHNTNSLYTGG